MRRIFLFLNILILLIWAILFWLLFFTPYSELFNKSVQLLSLEHKQEIFANLFNQTLVKRLEWTFAFLFFSHIAALIIFNRKPETKRKVWNCVRLMIDFPKWLWANYKGLSRAEKILFPLFLVLIILHRLLLSSETDVVYDEAWTYLAFTSKNPLVAFVFYPTSNNHVLFSHLTQILRVLPFSILTNLRLAALLPNILAIVTFFFCLRKYVKPFASWIGVVFFAFSFPMVYYGFVARGYSLIVFFFILGFFSVLNIIKDKSNEKAWNSLLISSVLGFYTIPVYLYPFVSLFGFVFIYFVTNKDTKFIKKTLIYGFLTSCLVIFLYSPIFVVSGIHSVLGNKYIQPTSVEEVFGGLIHHIYYSMRFFIGSSFNGFRDIIKNGGPFIAFGICLTLYVSGIVGVIKFRNIPGIALSLVCLLLAPVFVLIHRIIPVERTWIYLLIPVVFIISRILNRITWHIPIAILTVFYLVILNMSWLSQMLWYNRACEEDYLDGIYFTEYFHGKQISLASSTRMNTYLKFNGILKNEAWDIQSEVTPLNKYIIQYTNDEEPDSIYAGFRIDRSYGGYRLLVKEIK